MSPDELKVWYIKHFGYDAPSIKMIQNIPSDELVALIDFETRVSLMYDAKITQEAYPDWQNVYEQLEATKVYELLFTIFEKVAVEQMVLKLNEVNHGT